MKKNISISLDEEQIQKIDEICKVSERTKSWIVKKALDSYFEDLEDLEIAAERLMTNKSEFLTENELRKQLETQE
jgi:predicted DNA-binding protein